MIALPLFPERCDECDPSFGCWNNPAECSKRPPMTEEFARDCLHCRRAVTLRYDAERGYFRGTCACGALCTSDPQLPASAAPNASPASDSDAK